MHCSLYQRLQRLSIDIVAPVNFSGVISPVFRQDPLRNALHLVERLAHASGGCGYAGINLRPGVYFYSKNEYPDGYLRRRLFERGVCWSIYVTGSGKRYTIAHITN